MTAQMQFLVPFRLMLLAVVAALMKSYEGLVMIRVNTSMTTTWVFIEAANSAVARALLEAQYGRGNVLQVIRAD